MPCAYGSIGGYSSRYGGEDDDAVAAAALPSVGVGGAGAGADAAAAATEAAPTAVAPAAAAAAVAARQRGEGERGGGVAVVRSARRAGAGRAAPHGGEGAVAPPRPHSERTGRARANARSSMAALLLTPVLLLRTPADRAPRPRCAGIIIDHAIGTSEHA
jgi:hypothetical protein